VTYNVQRELIEFYDAYANCRNSDQKDTCETLPVRSPNDDLPSRIIMFLKRSSVTASNLMHA
jgi:hypothetical protein